jgi:hypothetical protein
MTTKTDFDWEDVPAGGDFIKWTKLGQEEEGDVADVREGSFGFEIVFTDGRILPLSLSDLRAKIKDAAPGIGDHVWAKFVAEKPTSQPSPMKVFEVRVTPRGPAPAVDDLA